MGIKLQVAKADEAAAIAALRTATAEKLTLQYGPGRWSGETSEKGVLFDMRHAKVYVARKGKKPIATLTLTTRKPWAIDRKYFKKSDRPIYLAAMAVAPEMQRRGIGRLCLEAACAIAKKWLGDAIRLDAFDAEAGAGEFYAKCGWREVGRAAYRGCPLIYYERLL